MEARVYAANLNPDCLAEIVAELQPEAPFAILEKPNDLIFPAQGALPPVVEWPKGWLFGPPLELRWEQQGETFYALLTLTDVRTAPPDFGEAIKTLPPGESCEYYLWGEDNRRLGRQLIYRALPPGGRAKLVVEEFREPDGAALVFYRYHSMRREKD